MQASSPDPLSGTSRYELLRVIGRGGMGVVYEAFDRIGNTRVALKTMRLDDASAFYRFKKEFRELADVSHPNLVALHELSSEGDTIFFTMELVDGVDFLRWVAKREFLETAPTMQANDEQAAMFRGGPSSGPSTQGDTRPDLHRLRGALRQLALGVHALHAAGKLHRDLKPSNVLITQEGRVVLLDFGLVTDMARGRETVGNNVAGTAEYMSPEQAANDNLTEATDWYSVGVMLYEALTGQLPIEGGPYQILMDKQRIDPLPPNEVAIDVPDDLNDLAMDLLRRVPVDRPTGVQVLARLSVDETISPTVVLQPSAPTLAQAFVGRARHLEVLTEAFERVLAGSGSSVFVHGGSGMGKSALVGRFLEVFQGVGDTVILSGRCYERESIPYKALDSLVDALSRYLLRLERSAASAFLPLGFSALARLFPVLRRVAALADLRREVEIRDPQELRRRAFIALRELFKRLCEHKTVIVWIDDLQWGDVDSIGILGELLRPPDPPELLFIASYRTEDMATSAALVALGEMRERLRDDISATTLEVGALTRDESIELALSLFGSQDAASRRVAAHLAAEAGGSAYFLGELARHARSGNTLRAPQSEQKTSFASVLSARFDDLPADARRLLEVVSVAGRPLTREVAMRAAGVPADAEASSLGVLRAGRLVRTSRSGGDETVETYHDRIRETLVASLANEAISSVHGRIANAMEASGAIDPEALAVHYREAGAPDVAAEWAARAGEKAFSALAFHRAAIWYRAALEVGSLADDDRRSLRSKLGDALANAGRGAEAAAEYALAARLARGADVFELQRRAAEQLFRVGHLEEAIVAVRKVLEPVGLRLPETLWGAIVALLFFRALIALRGFGYRERHESEISGQELARIDVCWSVNVGLGIVDPIRVQVFVKRGLLFALASGDPARISRAFGSEIVSSATRGPSYARRTATLVATAKAAAEVSNNAHSNAWVLASTGMAACLEGRWRDSLGSLDEGARRLRTECTGATWEYASASVFALWALYWLGDMRELALRVPPLQKDAFERGDLYLSTNSRIGRANVLWLVDDDPERAELEIESAMRRWPQHAVHVQHYHALLARVNARLYTGRGQEALDDVRGCWSPFARAFLYNVQTIRIDMLHLRGRSALSAATTSSDPEVLLRSAERDARRIARTRAPWADPLATLLLAGVAHARGNVERAAALLDEASTRFDAQQMNLLAAVARRRRGAILGGDDGRALVASADAFMIAQTIKNPARMADMFAPGFAVAARTTAPSTEVITRSLAPRAPAYQPCARDS